MGASFRRSLLEPVEAPAVPAAAAPAFDAAGYLAAYPDVAAAVARGETTALQHWQNYGQKEGRIGTGAGVTPVPYAAPPAATPAPALQIGQLPSTKGAPEQFFTTPGQMAGGGESSYMTSPTFSGNPAYLDYLNANKGAAPSENAYWVAPGFTDTSANSETGQTQPGVNPLQVSGGFWNTPGGSWADDIGGFIKDFAQSPVALAALGVATGGLGLGTSIGGGLGLSGAAATAVGNGLLTSGVSALGGKNLQDSLTSGLLAGAGSYAGSTLKDAIGGMTSAPAITPDFSDTANVASGAAGSVQATLDSLPSLSSINALPDALSAAAQVASTAPASVTQTLSSLPNLSAPSPTIPTGLLSDIQQVANSAPQAVQQTLDTVPDISAPQIQTPSTPPTFRPSVDSQQANTQLGLNGSDIAATAPKTINMGDLGGTTATTGGLLGAVDVAKQVGTDALGTVTSAAGDVASFLKANPTLGRLLFGGAVAALNTTGTSGGSTAGTSTSYGAPKQWTAPASALNAGLLGANQKQVLPPAMTGLLGNANSGAWRWGK